MDECRRKTTSATEAMRVSRTLRSVLGALCLFLFVPGCAPPLYWARPFGGTVIDANTQEPLKGAVVVAVWVYRRVVFPESYTPEMDQVETETDDNGRYHFKGWGPRLRRPFARLAWDSPRLLVAKRGYFPGEFRNLKPHYWWFSRRSDWSDELLPLLPVSNDRKIQLEKLRMILSGVSHTLPFPQRFFGELIRYEADIGPAPLFNHLRELKELKQFKPRG